MDVSTNIAATANARLVELSGRLFFSVQDAQGRSVSSPVAWSDLQSPEGTAARIERATGVLLALPDAGAWPRVVLDAWRHGGLVQ